MKNSKLLTISLISLFLFIILLFSINVFSPVDQLVNSSIANMQTPFLINIAKAIGLILEPLNLIIVSLLFSLLLFIKKYKKKSFAFALSMLSGGALMYVLKEIIQRPRPINALIIESGFSFPSGHAIISIILFGFLIYFVLKKKICCKKTLIILLSLIIAIVGFSRIYLNVHYLTDVLGGFLLGLAVLLFAIGISLKNI